MVLTTNPGFFRATTVLAAFALLLTAGSARAIDSCKVKVDKKTGVILVDATNVGGPLLWGEQAGQETIALFNSGTCVASGKAKKCQLADPATLASKTPPSGCTLYLDDGTAACSAWIPGCTPSPRAGAGGLVKDSLGAVIGYSADPSAQFVIRDDSGAPVRLLLLADGSGFAANGQLYFAANNCTGPPLMTPNPLMVRAVNVVSSSQGYYAPTSGTMQPFQSILNLLAGINDQAGCDGYYGMGIMTFVAPHGCCYSFPSLSQVMGTPVAVDLSGFVPPFSVEVQ